MNKDHEKWMSNEQLACRLGVPLMTIRKWRYEGTGPLGVRLGGCVRYAVEEVERWEREQIAKAARPEPAPAA